MKADPEIFNAFKGRSAIIIVPFDEKAAIECALNIAEALRTGGKKGVQPDVSWQKIKFDHQILAIAKVNAAATLYSEDAGLRKFAASFGMYASGTDDLPDNPDAMQGKLDLSVAKPDNDAS